MTPLVLYIIDLNILVWIISAYQAISKRKNHEITLISKNSEAQEKAIKFFI